MSRWFRHYAGMMRDDKLVRAALKAKQPIERVVWIWGAILESASEINDDGRFDVDPAEIAYFLRADEADIRAIFAALVDAGRLADGVVVNWSARQFQSDRSASRQAAYRERKRQTSGDGEDRQGDGGVTASSRHGDAPETETETETENKQGRSVGKPTRPDIEKSFDEFWQEYPKRDGANPRKPAKAAFGTAIKSGHDPTAIIAGAKAYAAQCRSRRIFATGYVAQAVTWLHQARWEDDHAAVAAISRETEAEHFEKSCATYAKTGGRHWTGRGAQPGYGGCECPKEILAKHGIDPETGEVSAMRRAS